jgi:hypothetical protein
MYDEFLVKLKDVKFLNWNDIMELYPDLKWSEIGKRLRYENDRILSRV